MRNQRVLVLMNKYTVPPKYVDEKTLNRDEPNWIMQYDVISNLKKLNYEVERIGLANDLQPLKEKIDTFKPSIVFNLIYEFAGESIFDQNVVSYLELLKIPYTGCNPRSLTISRNKATTKKILHFHNILTPSFQVFEKDTAIVPNPDLKKPLIVKCLTEDASLGIHKGSLVYDDKKLIERVNYLHENFENDAIAEQFIPGRELSMGVLGNKRLSAFPIWEIIFENCDSPEFEFYHSHAKWNNAYRRRKGIRTQRADISKQTEQLIQRVGKKVYKVLDLNGYARIDFRMTKDGKLYVIEANPNPDLSISEDFSLSAKENGISYQTLLKRIINLGLM